MTFKKVKTFKDIQNDPRVVSIHHEDEGFEHDSSYWCYLKNGFQAYNNQQHSIHEETIKDICNVLNSDVTVWVDDPDL